jgi:hypothetical protein
MLTPAEIDRLATSTEDAYSFNRYTNWRACAALLARRGYTYREAETILRSKWMRWAGDASSNRYGRVSSRDLARFLETPTCSRANLDRMLREM